MARGAAAKVVALSLSHSSHSAGHRVVYFDTSWDASENVLAGDLWGAFNRFISMSILHSAGVLLLGFFRALARRDARVARRAEARYLVCRRVEKGEALDRRRDANATLPATLFIERTK